MEDANVSRMSIVASGGPDTYAPEQSNMLTIPSPAALQVQLGDGEPLRNPWLPVDDDWFNASLGPNAGIHSNAPIEIMYEQDFEELETSDDTQLDHHPALSLRLQEEETEISREPAPRNTRDCIICTEELPSFSFPERAPTAECTHDISICTAYMDKRTTEDLETHGWDKIRCSICFFSLNHSKIQRGASAETFAR